MTMAVVPAPADIRADASAAPFEVTAGIRLSGEPGAVAAFTALLAARTGIAAEPGAGGTVSFTLDSGAYPESYRISVTAASIAVQGPDAAGLFYGAQTLGQLLVRDGGRWAIPAVEIDDAPRFAYRGLMLDVARHFFDVDTVKAVIDRAASLKLNRLHLHLTDDQAWRLALDSRPLLAECASTGAVGGDPGGCYTKADYAEIVRYAATRHMVVVPEIDLPGHTHAVGLAHPELVEDPVISETVAQTVAEFGGGLPAAGEPYTGLAVGFSSLRTGDEATYDFVADVFGELAAMTPGEYLHFGGDESLATDPDAFAGFVARVSQLIAALGKTPVAWHEAGIGPALHDATVGQYWGFTTPADGMDDKARAFVANGSQLILSPADAVYLDMKPHAGFSIGLEWANGPTDARRAYEWEPADLIAGVDERAILGVEAALWTETVRTLDDIDALAFPRLAAAAEAAWSPATGTSPLRTWESFRARVGRLGPLWASLGIGFTPVPEIDWSVG